MKRLIWHIVGVIGILGLTLAGAATPKAMIIYDASGSMWGQIDGRNKVVIARDALKSVVEKWNPKIALEVKGVR
jgi:Ca-activated chloride channel family protein